MAIVYSFLLFLAAITSSVIMVFAWRRRGVVGASMIALLMLAMTIWSGSYALYWANAFAPTRHFWLDLTYVGVVIVPVALFVFTLQYTNRTEWLTAPVKTILIFEPLVTVIVMWTDPLHGLFFGGMRLDSQNAILKGGPWFWLNVIFIYLLVLISVLLLMDEFRRSPPMYRGQSGLILIGALLPWLSSFIGLSGISLVPNLDLTPFAFTATGIAFAYALFAYHLLDIVPVARHLLIDEMNDGLLVLDTKNRVLDINPAMRKMLSPPEQSLIGFPVAALLQNWPVLIERYQDKSDWSEELFLPGPPPAFLDMRISPLRDHHGKLNGRLIIVRDITDRKRVEADLQASNTQLQTQLKEIAALQEELRIQAIRDPLTGVFNRRFFEETLERELAQAQRENHPLSVVMVDIDHFKEFNDQYGHKAGDQMLVAIASLLQKHTRRGDLICRYGGEEFVIILPATNLENAHLRMEALRAEIEALRVPYKEILLNTTISTGIAAYPNHGDNSDELLTDADRAMYIAKDAGRNSVRVWELP